MAFPGVSRSPPSRALRRSPSATLGEIRGTFAIAKDAANSRLLVSASGVSATVGAGSAALRLTDAAGSFVLTSDGAAGWAHGNAELAGVND